MKTQNREVIIFHTNDIHSHLDNVARVQTLIEQYRYHYSPEQILLIDLGDFMDRAALETEGTDGLVHRDLLNYMQYDAITLGNNEGLSFTHEQLTHVYAAPTSFQVICCNMEPLDGSSLNWLLKHTIIEKNGIRFGIVGASINYTDFYKLLNWDVTEPIAAIKKEIEHLKSKVDVVIVMSHLGISFDEELVKQCPEIDLLFGAHTHHTFNPPQFRGQTLMCAAGVGGVYIGEVRINMNNDEVKPQMSGCVHNTDRYDKHPKVVEIIEKHRKDAIDHLSEIITTTQEDLETDDFEESVLPNLLAIGLRNWCKTPLAIVNSGQILSSLKSGEISKLDVHRICPAPINPCVMNIKGKYIREAFEQSILHEYRSKRIKGYGFRGKQLGYLAVAGFAINIFVNRQINATYLKISVQDKQLNDEEIYSVATIDMFTFKHGYPSLGEFDDIQYFVPEYIRHILAENLSHPEYIEESKQKKWIYKGLDKGK